MTDELGVSTLRVMRKFLKLLFAARPNNIDNIDTRTFRKSNLFQLVVSVPIFILLAFILQKYGIVSFTLVLLAIIVLIAIGFVWSGRS